MTGEGTDTPRISGYGFGKVDTIVTADDVAREAALLADTAPSRDEIAALVGGPPLLTVDGLVAGYGKMEILHGIDLQIAAGQSLCLVGPNGAGKSTVLHSIYGFTRIMSGSIAMAGQDVTRLPASAKLRDAGIAYILQDNSVFPDMSVEENLWMGGYLMGASAAKAAAQRILAKYPRLAERRAQPARVLSGGERRLLEIARALVMDPKILLVDEPSIGLEPRYIDMVFEILADLQRKDGKTILMVEQNARKGLEFADLGYVLVAGRIARAGRGRDLLADPAVARLFLGG
ncbi:MAG: branched-chain amino acid transporter [Rhodospirillales bacterium]|nr:branched-chain amino acid transporter [Rhodospirillales bacterium]